MNRLNTLLKKKSLTPKEYKEMLLLTRKLFKSAGINLYQPVTLLMSYAYDGIAPRTYIKKGDQIEAKAEDDEFATKENLFDVLLEKARKQVAIANERKAEEYDSWYRAYCD